MVAVGPRKGYGSSEGEEAVVPRANRYIVNGQVYHVTHRCHNRSFLFKYACDRDVYRERLRLASKKYDLSVLGYCITSSHTHMLIYCRATGALSAMMQKLEGEFAEYYNLRNSRSGAFWGGRYHATMIDTGDYFWNCLKYIDLNMVRAGVVSHPAEWKWCGYTELVGTRKRYRILDMQEVLRQGPCLDPAALQSTYRDSIAAEIEMGCREREAIWTENIAVGRQEFVERIALAVGPDRARLTIDERAPGRWTLREPSPLYSLRDGDLDPPNTGGAPGFDT
jgi:putative transposase